jgi:hypothetical protein
MESDSPPNYAYLRVDVPRFAILQVVPNSLRFLAYFAMGSRRWGGYFYYCT